MTVKLDEVETFSSSVVLEYQSLAVQTQPTERSHLFLHIQYQMSTTQRAVVESTYVPFHTEKDRLMFYIHLNAPKRKH